MSARRFLSLLLAFILGFLSCIGVIATAGYLVYAKASVDRLNRYGIISIDESQYLGEDADVDLSAMTIKGLLAEIKELEKLGEPITIDLLVERYKLKVPDELMDKIPTGVRNMSVKDILSSDGLNNILENTNIDYIFQYLPDGLLGDPAKETLGGHSLKEVIDLNLTSLLEGVKLGYFTGVSYNRDTEGNYVSVYKDPANPTLMELVSGIDLGKALSTIGKGGNVLQVLEEGIGDVMLDLLVGCFVDTDSLLIGGLFEEKKVEDLIKKDANGNYSLDVLSLLNGRKVGEILGYTPTYLNGDESTGKVVGWTDKNGKKVEGIIRGFADVTPTGLGTSSFSASSLINDIYLGFLMGNEPVYDSLGEITGWVDGAGNSLSRLLTNLSNKKLSVLMGDDLSIDTLLAGLYVGDLLDYTPVFGDSSQPDKVTGWKDNNNQDVDRLMDALAKKQITELTSGSFEIDDLFDGLYVGDLLKYTPVKDGDGNITSWTDSNGAPLDRVSEKLAEKEVSTLISGTFEVNSILEGLYVGDLLKYDPVKDAGDNIIGWKNGGEDVKGIDRAIAGIDLYRLINDNTYSVSDAFSDTYIGEVMKYEQGDVIPNSDPLDTTVRYKWYKESSTNPGVFDVEVTGIERKLANYSLGDLINGNVQIDDLTDGVTIAEILNLHAVEALAYDKDGNPLLYTSGEFVGQQFKVKLWFDSSDVQAADAVVALAECTVDTISTALDGITVGKFIGNISFEGKAYTGEFKTVLGESRYCLTESEGVISHLSDLTIGQLSDSDAVSNRIKSVKIGEAMGYVLNGGVWYTDSTLATPVTGMMKALAPKTVGDMETVADDLKVGELLGYTKDGGIWYETFVGTGDPSNVKASGIMGSIADSTINSLSTDIDTIRIGSVLNYVKYENELDPTDPKNGKWFTDSTYTVEATGIMVSFADLTISEMSDSDKVSNATKNILIGEAMGYTLDGGVWYTDSTLATPVTGMMKALAPKTVGDMETIADDLKVGELLGYTKDGGIWYETFVGVGDPSNVKASGIMGSIADSTINSLSADIDAIRIGSILDYVKYENALDPTDPKNGKWFTDTTYTVEATGIMVSFADLTISEMSDSDKVSNATKTIVIGEAMGYTLDGGVWYTDSTLATPVTGVMKSIAPKKVSELDSLTDSLCVGQMMGYEKDSGIWYTDSTKTARVGGIMGAIADFTVSSLDSEIDGVYIGYVMDYYTNNPSNPKAGIWYTDESLTTPAVGIMTAFAGLTIGEMKDSDNVTNAVKTIKVGEAMGFTKSSGIWYTDSTLATPVTGAIRAVADSTIGSLETDLNATKIGDIIGYQYDTSENWWYDGSEKTSTLINTVADTELQNLGTKLSNLTVADMFSASERSSGFLSLLPPSAKLTELGGSGPNSMNSIFQNTTMGDYTDKGIITLSPTTVTKLNFAIPTWRNLTIQGFIDSIMTFLP